MIDSELVDILADYIYSITTIQDLSADVWSDLRAERIAEAFEVYYETKSIDLFEEKLMESYNE